MILSKSGGVAHLLKSAEMYYCKGFELLFNNFSRTTMKKNQKNMTINVFEGVQKKRDLGDCHTYIIYF